MIAASRSGCKRTYGWRSARTVLDVVRSRSSAELLRNLGTLLRPPAPYAQADQVTDLAVDWIDDLAGEPFFGWIHYMDVHGPYHPPDRYREQFQDNRVGVRRINEVWRRGLDNSDALSQDEVRTLIDAYDAEIRFVDHQLRRLFDHLSAEELLDETLVIVTADHGEEFREHGVISHRPRVYDELISVPLLVRDSRADVPDRVDELVSLLDIAPTVLAAFDASPPESYRGSPLQRFSAGGSGYDAVFAEVSHRPAGDDQRYQREEATVTYRTAERKYIRDNQVGEELFFDLTADPDETNPDPEGVTEADRETLREAVDAHLESLYASDGDTIGEVPEAVKERLNDLGYR